MSKTKDIEQLTNILAKALRHKIGSIVNENEFYAGKYAKDAEMLMKEAEKVLVKHSWNNEEKLAIRNKLRRKLNTELEKKDFLHEQKFVIMESEMEKALKELLW